MLISLNWLKGGLQTDNITDEELVKLIGSRLVEVEGTIDLSKKYKGITIHYYETWYQNLYCVWPDINKHYDGGEPKNC